MKAGSAMLSPNPDNRDKCANEIILCRKNAENNFYLLN
jgi:hypothetical protein